MIGPQRQPTGPPSLVSAVALGRQLPRFSCVGPLTKDGQNARAGSTTNGQPFAAMTTGLSALVSRQRSSPLPHTTFAGAAPRTSARPPSVAIAVSLLEIVSVSLVLPRAPSLARVGLTPPRSGSARRSESSSEAASTPLADRINPSSPFRIP